MSVLSAISCSLLSAVCAFTLVTAAGCGTSATGIDDCRQIEDARCAAAKNCGILSDVAECQRFYRDQCLHGLAVSSPGSTAVSACVATIHSAGVCAAAGADTPLTACDPPPSTTTSAVLACDIVANPEKASECAFLVPGADAGSSGSAGTSGSGGSSGNDSTTSGGAAGAN